MNMHQQRQNQQQVHLRAAKTKKIQLDTKTYIGLALLNALKKFWWAFLIPVAIMLIPVFYAPAFGWCLGIAITLTVLWVLFWVIQFAGITQMEQYKFIFEKMNYEFSSRQILMKLNAKQGMPLTWDKVQEVKRRKDYYIFSLSLAQFIYVPLSAFRSENDIKYLDSILKRKGLIASTEEVETSKK